MAKAVSGETSLLVGNRRQRLRLDIGTMMDLEDHFEMGLVPFLSRRLPEFRLKDMAILYLAMTGKDFSDQKKQRRAAQILVDAGLPAAATAISACFEATLSPSDGAAGPDGQIQKTDRDDGQHGQPVSGKSPPGKPQPDTQPAG